MSNKTTWIEQEIEILRDSCEVIPAENMFCFSIINREYFEQKVEIRKSKLKPRRSRIKRIYPRFRRGMVKNWKRLRFAPVNKSIRGVSSLSQKKLRILKELSEKESKCPNNVAISIGATLEDQLPEKISYQDVGKGVIHPCDSS